MEGAQQSPQKLDASRLLLMSGTLIGLSFPMAKLASANGLSPLFWAMLTSLGAVIALFPALWLQGRLQRPRGQHLRYCLIAGPLSFAAPNLLLVISVPHSGAGYTGLMFALSPLFTLVFAALLRQQTTSGLGVLGVVLGLLGAVVVSISRGSAADAPGLGYMLLALCIPMLLAAGNIYRSWDWPPGAAADELALWSHGFASLSYLLLLIATSGPQSLFQFGLAPALSSAQLLIAAATAPLIFRLQQRGGPVLLSQLGYVAASVSMLISASLLGEQYPPGAWAGAAAIALGIAISSAAAKRHAPLAEA